MTNVFLCPYCNKPKRTKYYSTCDAKECFERYDQERRAKNAVALQDPRVAAVRADEAVGSGSCATIDECMEHSELLDALIAENIQTPYDAVVYARERDGLHWENGLNQMSGEPETDDPIREMNNESRQRNKLPIKASKEPVK